MRKAWLLLIYGLSFSTTHAATLIDLGGSTCSGSQSFDTGNGLSFSCSGDFSLSAGSLSSNTSISVSSLGSLTLDGFTLSAPSITLNAASIFLKTNVSLTGDLINLSANSIVVDGLSSSDSATQILPGRDIIIPKPSLPSDGTITLLPLGGDISIGSGIRFPPASTPTPDGNILIAHGGDITVTAPPPLSTPPLVINSSVVNIPIFSGTLPLTPITSVPLPASFTMLLTGLLSLLSLSAPSVTRKSR
jgi:hypothetical protein